MNAIMLDDLACFLDIYIYIYYIYTYMILYHILDIQTSQPNYVNQGLVFSIGPRLGRMRRWLRLVMLHPAHESGAEEKMGHGGMFICKDVDFARKKW